MQRHFIIFFLDDFHHGAVNHLLHAIGFTLLGFGLGKENIILILLSPFIMELGHFYNYFTGKHKEYAVKIIPLQWIAWIFFISAGYFLTHL